MGLSHTTCTVWCMGNPQPTTTTCASNRQPPFLQHCKRGSMAYWWQSWQGSWPKEQWLASPWGMADTWSSEGEAWYSWSSNEEKKEGPNITATTSLGGTGAHTLKRECRLQILHEVFNKAQARLQEDGALLPGEPVLRLPPIASAQWSTTTIDSVVFILAKCKPKTPIRSLMPQGEFSIGTIADMMIDSMWCLHKPADLAKLLPPQLLLSMPAPTCTHASMGGCAHMRACE